MAILFHALHISTHTHTHVFCVRTRRACVRSLQNKGEFKVGKDPSHLKEEMREKMVIDDYQEKKTQAAAASAYHAFRYGVIYSRIIANMSE